MKSLLIYFSVAIRIQDDMDLIGEGLITGALKKKKV
jgi:hypothetical protein